jgi:hypothetical protein
MSLRNALIVTAVVGSLTAACGGSQDQQKEVAEQAEKAADSVASGAKEMAKGLESFAESMKEMADSANIKPVDPVSFKELQTVFGDLPGWEKGKPTGERMTMPVPFSQATVTYRMGDARIEAKAIDSGFNQLLMAPYAMFLTSGYEKETENGYEKSVKVGEYPGWETWNSANKSGELHAVVNKRFLVSFDGNGIDSNKPLYDLAKATALAKLGSLK